MSTLQSAPPAVAPKTQQEYFHLPAFPATGQQILTITAYNYIPEYINPFDDPPKPAFPAIEFIYGADTPGGVGFVAGLPTRYSLHEKATYPKLYKMATGKEATAGSKPDDMLGGGVAADVSNTEKTSKKGTKYTKSIVKDFAAVHPKLKGEITPLAKLKPALDALLAAKDKKPDSKENEPF